MSSGTTVSWVAPAALCSSPLGVNIVTPQGQLTRSACATGDDVLPQNVVVVVSVVGVYVGAGSVHQESDNASAHKRKNGHVCCCVLMNAHRGARCLCTHISFEYYLTTQSPHTLVCPVPTQCLDSRSTCSVGRWECLKRALSCQKAHHGPWIAMAVQVTPRLFGSGGRASCVPSHAASGMWMQPQA